jgi:DNA-binding transcriptional ArsR family regulator
MTPGLGSLERSAGRSPYEVKAQLFKGFGHPERVHILEVLSDGEQSVAELLQILGLTPSTMSRQLTVLRQAGLVERRRHHQRVVYRLTHPKAAELLAIARSLLNDRDQSTFPNG